MFFFFFFQAEDGIRDKLVTGVQTCALPISSAPRARRKRAWVVRPRQRAPRASAARLRAVKSRCAVRSCSPGRSRKSSRSEEHTSELQSLAYLVCRLLLEKKKNRTDNLPKPSATGSLNSRSTAHSQ